MQRLNTSRSRVFSALKECPSEEKLRLFLSDELPIQEAAEINSHIANCEFCAIQVNEILEGKSAPPEILPKDLKRSDEANRLSKIGADRLYKILGQKNPVPHFGQLWLSNTDVLVPTGQSKIKTLDRHGFGRIVLTLSEPSESLTENFQIVQVAPLSRELHYGTELDLLLSEETNPLGFEAMIEFWNINPMLAVNLRQFVGRFTDPTLLGQIKLMWKQAAGIKVPYTEIEEIPTGEIVFSPKDPRVRFQQREIDSTAYLREPVQALIELVEAEKETAMNRGQRALKKASEVLVLGQDIWNKVKGFVAAVFPQPVPPLQPVHVFKGEKKPSAHELNKPPESVQLFDKEKDWQLKGKVVFRDGNVYMYISGNAAPKVTKVTLRVSRGTKGTHILKRETMVANVAQYLVPKNLIRNVSKHGMTVTIHCGGKKYDLKMDAEGDKNDRR